MKIHIDLHSYLISAVIALLLFPSIGFSQKNSNGNLAAKPLFHDPVYDGAADPTVIWNRKEKKWFMFYTNRRASTPGLDGVTWVHGTRIGIAESSDGGASWKYRDTCNIRYRPDAGYTHWAPEVVENKGTYHMFLTYVPGVFSNWSHPRWIIHLTSKNLVDWDFQSKLQLASEKCIDACVFRLPDGTWRMYYNNEADKKSMYFADSPDLYTWTDSSRKVVGDQGGEGPNVFFWKGIAWMAVDNWNGLGIYSSGDFVTWKRQEKNILQEPGKGPDDGVKGQHPDIVVNGDRAFIIYFTHFGQAKGYLGVTDFSQSRRSAIQIAELEYADRQIVCDRDKPVFVNLMPPPRK
ncbi:MAG: glycosyl hydrolase [Bacteroidia bacterium]|nr:glycosyl hydrolase [Bacteroidia bacterium]